MYLKENFKVMVHQIVEPISYLFFGVVLKKDWTFPVEKRKIVSQYGMHFGCEILVETGTYLGEMCYAQRNNYKSIFSIEIVDFLADFSRKRLKKYANIHVLQGDSSEVLSEVVATVPDSQKILFWLDGHYSGGETGKGELECPIFGELETIFQYRKNKDVILIDDASYFDGNHKDYPDRETLYEYILSVHPNAQISLKKDIIRVVVG